MKTRAYLFVCALLLVVASYALAQNNPAAGGAAKPAQLDELVLLAHISCRDTGTHSDRFVPVDQSEVVDETAGVEPRGQIHVCAQDLVGKSEQMSWMHDALGPIEVERLPDLIELVDAISLGQGHRQGAKDHSLVKRFASRLEPGREDRRLRDGIGLLELMRRRLSTCQNRPYFAVTARGDRQVVACFDVQVITVVDRSDEPDLSFTSLEPPSSEMLDRRTSEICVHVDARNQAPSEAHASRIRIVVDEVRVFGRPIEGHDSQ